MGQLTRKIKLVHLASAILQSTLLVFYANKHRRILVIVNNMPLIVGCLPLFNMTVVVLHKVSQERVLSLCARLYRCSALPFEWLLDLLVLMFELGLHVAALIRALSGWVHFDLTGFKFVVYFQFNF